MAEAEEEEADAADGDVDEAQEAQVRIDAGAVLVAVSLKRRDRSFMRNVCFDADDLSTNLRDSASQAAKPSPMAPRP